MDLNSSWRNSHWMKFLYDHTISLESKSPLAIPTSVLGLGGSSSVVALTAIKLQDVFAKPSILRLGGVPPLLAAGALGCFGANWFVYRGLISLTN